MHGMVPRRLRQCSKLFAYSCLAIELLHEAQLLDFETFVHHIDSLDLLKLFTAPLKDH